MRRPGGGRRAAATAVCCLLSLASAGCSGAGTGREEPPGPPSAAATAPSRPVAPAAPPDTAEEFLARAEEAMAQEKGWTFAVEGREGLVLRGQANTATYTATVHRTTDEPWALHSTGTSVSGKGVARSEEVYVVDGTGYVKDGTAWRHGPLTEPGIADKVEDPVAALDALRTYADAVRPVESAGRLELRVRTAPAALPAVRGQGVVRKALRELAPTLEQLRAAGVTAPESRIRVERAEETVALDPATYRITSHTFRCAFLIPYGDRTIRYSQDVTQRTEGRFTGSIALPPEAG
ncbi:hypothetical protein GCM10027074_29810 [Streptomyces deserti]